MHHLDFKKAKELPYLYINIYNRKSAINSKFEKPTKMEHEGSIMRNSLHLHTKNSQVPTATVESNNHSELYTGNGRDTLKYNSRYNQDDIDYLNSDSI